MPMIGWGKAQICHRMGGERLKYATGWMGNGSDMPHGRVGKGYANDRVGKDSNMPMGKDLKYSTGWAGKGSNMSLARW